MMIPSAQGHREIELKFTLDETAARRIARHPLLADVGHRTRSQHSIYFDTPKEKLRKKGYTLRVRQVGDFFVQTLKSRAGIAGLFDRGEWEMPVQRMQPALDLLSHAPLKKLHHVDGKLVPTVRSDVVRTTWTIDLDQSAIEVVLDSGVVRAFRKEAPFHELELELKDGAGEDLFAFARLVLDAVPMRIGVQTKEERGRALGRTAGKVIKAQKLRFDDGMNVEQAFAQILMSCIRHFRLNERLILAERDEEALHQARTAMRRLSGAFILFRPAIRRSSLKPLKRELRWLSDTLAPARDIDVFLAGHSELGWTDRRRLRLARQDAYERVCSAIDSRRFRNLMLDLVEWVAIGDWQKGPASDPIGKFAATRLDLLWKIVRKRQSHLSELGEKRLHRLRIGVKNLRYAVEFLASLYGKDARKLASRLGDIQDALGALNDEAIGRQLIASLSLRNGADERSAKSRTECLHLASKKFRAIGKSGRPWT